MLLGILLTLALAPVLALAQSTPPSEPAPAPDQDAVPDYKPPLRGAPGGRVGGASRGAVRLATPLPTIELLAPNDEAGQTTSATPTLYFFVSQAVAWPTQFTISAPLQPAPVLEVTIPSPRAAGIYALRLADYRARLEPGIVYTWSVSIIVDPKSWARNVVASAALLRVPEDAATASATRDRTPPRRAAAYAAAGLWYDAVAAAAEARNLDRHAALDALMQQVGLTKAADYDRDHQ